MISIWMYTNHPSFINLSNGHQMVNIIGQVNWWWRIFLHSHEYLIYLLAPPTPPLAQKADAIWLHFNCVVSITCALVACCLSIDRPHAGRRWCKGRRWKKQRLGGRARKEKRAKGCRSGRVQRKRILMQSIMDRDHPSPLSLAYFYSITPF